jgi:hypothetical protein
MAMPAQEARSAAPAPEVQVTASFIIDYEFDWGRDGVNCPTCNFGAGNSRVAWVDSLYNLWVAQVNPQTGKWSPVDGRGVLVDTGAAFASDFGNGPEWMLSTAGSQLVYNKYQPGVPPSPDVVGLAMAVPASISTWTAGFLPNGQKRINPIGSLNLTDSQPRVHYQDVNKIKTIWRMANDASTEALVPVQGFNGGSRRWVPGTNKMILSGSGAAGAPGSVFKQVYLYDTDTGALEQITTDLANHSGAFMWKAPEFGNEYVFFCTRNYTQMAVYRNLPDGTGVKRWTQVVGLTLPATSPYVWSPEPFVFNGKSYIFFQMNSNSNSSDLTQPSWLGLMGILPENSGLTMLTPADAPARMRMDPEYFITAQGPFIYYNRYKPAPQAPTGAVSEGVWRVDTQLGPPAAFDFRAARW